MTLDEIERRSMACADASLRIRLDRLARRSVAFSVIANDPILTDANRSSVGRRAKNATSGVRPVEASHS